MGDPKSREGRIRIGRLTRFPLVLRLRAMWSPNRLHKVCKLHLFIAAPTPPENVGRFSPAARAWPAETRLPDWAERRLEIGNVGAKISL
jgi:hypothetical protein